MLKVLKGASEEESRIVGSNTSNLSSWEDKGSSHCWEGYRQRDRCEERDDSISGKCEEPEATKMELSNRNYEA